MTDATRLTATATVERSSLEWILFLDDITTTNTDGAPLGTWWATDGATDADRLLVAYSPNSVSAATFAPSWVGKGLQVLDGDDLVGVPVDVAYSDSVVTVADLAGAFSLDGGDLFDPTYDDGLISLPVASIETLLANAGRTRFDALDDVSATGDTAPDDGQVPTWDAVEEKWIPADPPAGGGSGTVDDPYLVDLSGDPAGFFSEDLTGLSLAVRAVTVKPPATGDSTVELSFDESPRDPVLVRMLAPATSGSITNYATGQEASGSDTADAIAAVISDASGDPRVRWFTLGTTGAPSVTLSDADPADLGNADPGVSGEVSRADHVHDMPSAADVGAVPTARTVNGHALSADVTVSASDITTGTLPIAQVPTGTTSTTVPLGNDSRFSDARTPTGTAGGDLAGTYPNPTIGAGKVTDAMLAGSITPSKVTGTAVVTGDSRLSDARTPTAHAASHKAGGSDPLATRLTFSNADYTIVTTTPSTVVSQTGTLSAARVVTLPAASTVPAGAEVIVQAGIGCSGTNTLSIARAGSDTINGSASSLVVSTAYAWRRLVSDGSSAWTVDAGILRASDLGVTVQAYNANNVAGDGTILNVVALTQSSYDALSPPVSTTLYVITGP